jgi:hypothetical protein
LQLVIKLKTSLGTDNIVDKTSVVQGLSYNADAYNVSLPHFLGLLGSQEWSEFCDEVKRHLQAAAAKSDPSYAAAALGFQKDDFSEATEDKRGRKDTRRAGKRSNDGGGGSGGPQSSNNSKKQPAESNNSRRQREEEEEEEGRRLNKAKSLDLRRGEQQQRQQRLPPAPPSSPHRVSVTKAQPIATLPKRAKPISTESDTDELEVEVGEEEYSESE